MKRLASAAILAFVVACGGAQETRATEGGIREVQVVLKDPSEPLPFDPRAGRMARVTGELTNLLGHPIVLELDAALSPELRASLERSVLGSFENLVRELVVLKREDPEAFAAAKRLERVVCRYVATAKQSEATIVERGKVLVVRAPPEQFPLLERGVASEALWSAEVDALDARWGEADPARIPAREHAAYFAYMLRTRPGYGYLWSFKRAKGDSSARRLEHAGRIVRLAAVVEPRSELEHRVRRWLLEAAPFIANGEGHETARTYEAWLVRAAPSFDDEERLLLARALFGRDAVPERAFPTFDRFGFALAVFDEWAREGARTDLPSTPRGALQKIVLCPAKRLGDAEIRYGCSAFFARALQGDDGQARLADAILKRRDARLLELALLNPGTNEGDKTVALVDRVSRDDGLFKIGVRLLFEELARRDDVKRALEDAAPRWWRDAPARRGLALLVLARRWEHLDVHYGDNQWERFPAEFGGPVSRDVLSAYLAEGARAVEMAPKIWPALAKGPDRDALVARSLPALLRLGAARAQPALLLLKKRLCDERDAGGLSAVKAELDRWAHEHADDAPIASAARDMTLARCASPTARE